MTDTVDAANNTDTQSFLDPNIRTPEMEMTEKGAGVPPVAELALEDINPTNPHLFKEDRWQEVFARLRAEASAPTSSVPTGVTSVVVPGLPKHPS